MLTSNQICPICNERMSQYHLQVKFHCYKNTCNIEIEQKYNNVCYIIFILNNVKYLVKCYDEKDIKYCELFYYKGIDTYFIYGFKQETIDFKNIYETSIKYITNLVFL